MAGSLRARDRLACMGGRRAARLRSGHTLQASHRKMPGVLQLLKPTLDWLPGYFAALQQGWSPDNLRPEAAQEEIVKIEQDPASFIASLDDPDARGSAITLPDGSRTQRLPGY